MLEITAICKTETCSFLDKPSVFRSETVATQCGQCGNMMETTTKEVTEEPEEVTDGRAEETE